MKVVTYILIVLLLALFGIGGYLYTSVYKPMEADLARFKTGQPEFDKARAELRKCRDREKKEAEQLAWVGPTADSLKKAFENEIASGKAEVVTARDTVVLNLAEGVLYTAHAKTFAKESPQIRATIAQLLKGIKDKDIRIGNMTQAAPARGRGRRKIPGMDARTLGALRSVELAKDLVKNDVPEGALIVESYPEKRPDRGFKLKEKKTIIMITPPVDATPAAAAPAPPQGQPKTGPSAAPATTPAPQPQGQQNKLIPISPGPPPAQ